MGNISKNFSRWEFKCKCGNCDCDTVDAELIRLLEIIREHFGGARITINSGHRCAKHNKMEGGAKNSQHLKARAADFIVEGVDPRRVQAYIDGRWSNSLGMGRYLTFTHLDTRTEFTRW